MFWTKLATGTVLPVHPYGQPTDLIVPGDYDGDGKTDIATARSSGGAIHWYSKRSTDGVMIGPVIFGVAATDDPVQGDYDGDGKTDIAVWRSTGLFISRSTATGAATYFALGSNGDYAVAAFNSH
ncbi:MAG: multicopper oxidase, manganese oxidase family, repeat-containing [Acidobacteria bacterium]|nr:multicopper oxidase, manganese oxidase family, repeat-containing [Acidobacteriota bacterium]